MTTIQHSRAGRRQAQRRIRPRRSPAMPLIVLAWAGAAAVTWLWWANTPAVLAERGCHILDPHTGEPPVSALAAMTVVGSSLTVVDALATAAYAMGDAGCPWLEEQPDAEGLATAATGVTRQTAGFARWTA
ncbi:FAD:protein FMN transferase [Streptomyces sp. NPDC015661]|uniref:FAD:protein FMN transferase n=1 Tax=Streptomyces sp. NPDC015661 TaxID=3364961 RepID=UPI0036FE4E0C